MTENHHRRSIRLQGYDYSQNGAYFLTACTQNREGLFGHIADGEMVLNDAGRMLRAVWDELPMRFSNMELDRFIVMPNHIHGIIVLCRRGDPCDRPYPCDRPESCIRPVAPNHTSGGRKGDRRGDHKDRPYGTLPGTLGRIVQAFKSIATHKYVNGVKQHGWLSFPGKLWQRNYYEHIIRNENKLNRVREYIIDNPLKWELDRENPMARTRPAVSQQDEPWQI